MPDGPAPLEGRAGWSRAWQEPAFRRNAILTLLFLFRGFSPRSGFTLILLLRFMLGAKSFERGDSRCAIRREDELVFPFQIMLHPAGVFVGLDALE